MSAWNESFASVSAVIGSHHTLRTYTPQFPDALTLRWFLLFIRCRGLERAPRRCCGTGIFIPGHVLLFFPGRGATNSNLTMAHRSLGLNIWHPCRCAAARTPEQTHEQTSPKHRSPFHRRATRRCMNALSLFVPVLSCAQLRGLMVGFLRYHVSDDEYPRR